jgi:hypothetical protein
MVNEQHLQKTQLEKILHYAHEATKGLALKLSTGSDTMK